MEQNLSLYRVFYTVANAGNISKAAEQLYISQPAISKSIRKLEQSLDVTYFPEIPEAYSSPKKGKSSMTTCRKHSIPCRWENPALKK